MMSKKQQQQRNIRHFCFIWMRKKPLLSFWFWGDRTITQRWILFFLLLLFVLFFHCSRWFIFSSEQLIKETEIYFIREIVSLINKFYGLGSGFFGISDQATTLYINKSKCISVRGWIFWSNINRFTFSIRSSPLHFTHSISTLDDFYITFDR